MWDENSKKGNNKFIPKSNTESGPQNVNIEPYVWDCHFGIKATQTLFSIKFSRIVG